MANYTQFSGIATPYTGNGRRLGYPTANITAPSDAPEGVFAGKVVLENRELPAMIFIGAPVTLDDTRRRAEAYILDFEDRDLYGSELTFILEKHIRDNKKFDSLDTLIEAMKQDEARTREFYHK